MKSISRSVVLLFAMTLGMFLSYGSGELTAKETRLNAAVTSLEAAKVLAQEASVYKLLPNFDVNYKLLQEKCKKALDIPRIDMPVIEPKNIKIFQKKLEEGHIDIFQPYALHELFKDKESGEYDPFPIDLKRDSERGKTWLTLGTKDGSIDDEDKIVATIEYVAAKDLIPTQSQIWLNKLINSMAKYGVPDPDRNPFIFTQTIIISKEGYILDGHHRFGQVILTNPSFKMKVLRVPLDINLLLKMGRSYGNAIGNLQKE